MGQVEIQLGLQLLAIERFDLGRDLTPFSDCFFRDLHQPSPL